MFKIEIRPIEMWGFNFRVGEPGNGEGGNFFDFPDTNIQVPKYRRLSVHALRYSECLPTKAVLVHMREMLSHQIHTRYTGFIQSSHFIIS